MKDKFGIVKKSHGYEINSINNQGVCFTTHILAGKVMQKCRANEIPIAVVSLAV